MKVLKIKKLLKASLGYIFKHFFFDDDILTVGIRNFFIQKQMIKIKNDVSIFNRFKIFLNLVKLLILCIL
ncbi:hypothetical protein ATE47_13425 [Chryseobacterium sp. IHB B 17019]|nr:hypothetical protein ATE47_13425 [Chryseobacterium sp. IHB B 17019]